MIPSLGGDMRRAATNVSVLCLLCAAASGSPEGNRVVVRPVETHEILVNPGMGITTFQRYNGDELNSGSTWSEEGPTEILSAPSTSPGFPDTSIAYCRWFWSVLEPERGRYRWDILDLALEQARLHHQTLAIRLMPYDPDHPLPEWYRRSGAQRVHSPSDEHGRIWEPDFSDPLYLRYWGELVGAAGARYDGHPLLESVDISSVGYWGEGWSPNLPDFERQKALIDIYFDAFTRTTLLMNFDEPEALSYGTARGAGWRLDCLGDMRTSSVNPFFPPEMLDVYPQQVVRTGIGDVWKTRPVALETCWVPGYWKEQGWDVDAILDQALRWHVSSLNVKSSALPAEWRESFDRFQIKMGYRLVLRRLEYPGAVRAGENMDVQMWWLNSGVAPIYRDVRLALQFHSRLESVPISTSADPRRWLPGDAIYEERLDVPDHLNPGRYRLRLALVDPATGVPVVRLSILGREPDGWYDLGAIEVESLHHQDLIPGNGPSSADDASRSRAGVSIAYTEPGSG